MQKVISISIHPTLASVLAKTANRTERSVSSIVEDALFLYFRNHTTAKELRERLFKSHSIEISKPPSHEPFCAGDLIASTESHPAYSVLSVAPIQNSFRYVLGTDTNHHIVIMHEQLIKLGYEVSDKQSEA